MSLKKVLSSIFVISLLGCGSVEESYIPAEDFEQFYISRKIKTLLIDIRDEESFNRSHIEGAINVPLDNINLEEFISGYNSSHWVLFVYSDNNLEIKGFREYMKNKKIKGNYYNKLTYIYYIKHPTE